jgi:hypothetical protein
LSEEYETAGKKKRALDNLLSEGRISRSTYELFDKEISEAIAEIGKQQQLLQEKIDAKMGELADQVKTLEILLANFELQHVTGEIDEETYQREIEVLSVGLETAKQELDAIKEVSDHLLKGNLALQEHESPETAVEAAEEKQAEPVVEFAQANQQETPTPQEEAQQETLQVSNEAEKVEENQEAQQ